VLDPSVTINNGANNGANHRSNHTPTTALTTAPTKARITAQIGAPVRVHSLKIVPNASSFFATVLLAALGLVCISASATPANHGGVPATARAACPSLMNHQMRTLRGQPLDLCQFQGKVTLIVNTASYCGFTQQYRSLEAIYRKYRSRGLVVIGFPANDFGAQEPGSNQEVAEFCERTFQVSFPMAEKTGVLGPNAHPLWLTLASRTNSPPKWNFHKYLVDRQGDKVEAFGSRVAPDSPEFIARVEALLTAR
jgi:glutathione peroxidase